MLVIQLVSGWAKRVKIAMPLTDTACRKVKSVERQFKMSDGEGLYLLVRPNGSKLWQMAYRYGGQQKTLSFGPYPDVSLFEARERRQEAKVQLRALVDPGIMRKDAKRALRQEVENSFDELVRDYLGRLKDKRCAPATMRKNEWMLERLASPVFGRRSISEINSAEILTFLQRIERKGSHETAVRMRSTLSAVFRLAITTLRAERDPTEALKGAIRPPLVEHRAAITDPVKFGRLLDVIDHFEGWPTIRACLQIQALCFTRPTETRTMRWSEVDLKKATWSIPAEKTKMRRAHDVPLSRQVVDILQFTKNLSVSDQLVFPQIHARSRPLSENAMNVSLRRMGVAGNEHCAHGFRSSASTILNESGFDPEVIELQLAHLDRNQVRRVYNRSLHWERRVALMQAWADMCDQMKKPGS
jgi:integrase